MENKNKTTKKFLWMLFVLTLTAVTITSAYASNGLNVVLSSQNPDPVAPGNFVFVNIKLSNTDTIAANNVKITFLENEYFTIDTQDKITKELGAIPAYSFDEKSSSFVIAKYRLLVSEETPLGTNNAIFEVQTSTGKTEYELNILVQDANLTLHVNNFSINTIGPGETSPLTIELENKNSVNLRDIIIKLNLDEVEDKVLNIEEGSNQKSISLLQAGEKAQIKYQLIASPDATAKPYLLPITITYKDTLGNTQETEILGSIKIYSKPQLSIRVDSQEIYTKGKGKITFAVANPGTSTIKGTRIEILDSENYQSIEGKYQYVGDLNPDDFQTIQTEMIITNEEMNSINLKINYLDSYNTEKEEIIAVPINIYTSRELKKLGIQQEDGGSNWFLILLLIGGIIAAYYYGKKKSHKKETS